MRSIFSSSEKEINYQKKSWWVILKLSLIKDQCLYNSHSLKIWELLIIAPLHNNKFSFVLKHHLQGVQSFIKMALSLSIKM